MIVAGVDVGGTNIEVGLVDDNHHVSARAKRPTPRKGPESVVEAIVEMIESFSDRPNAVGVGIPGVVHESTVLTTPNLANWSGHTDLTAMLGKHLDMPIALGNDANMGVLGEWLAGAARGHDDVLGVWMGTGIGGGLILGGRPYFGSRGASGELGHVLVQPGGALCICGRRGCAEAYAGRRSMAGVIAAMVDAGHQTSIYEIQRAVGKTALTSKVWAKALHEHDKLTMQVFATAIDMISIAIASVVNVLDVELIVIGGGLAEKLGQPLAERIALAATPWMLQPNPSLRFVATELGDDAGVVGAASIARARLITGPAEP
jgi:glucokinase